MNRPSTKCGEHYYIEWLQNNKQKENRVILCVVNLQWESMKRWRTLIHSMITKQWVKNEQIKRKQTYLLCFVIVFKFQENKLKIVQKNFWKIKMILIKKKFLEKSPVTMIIAWVVKGQRLTVIHCWPALICSAALLIFPTVIQ